MEDEKLIEAVRQFQLLYDLNHPKYMDNTKKDIAWKEISQRVKQPPAACKQRWQSLRDSYRRALHKRKSKHGTSTKVKRWKYEEEMTFLAPYFGRRKKDSDGVSDDEEDEENDDSQLGSWAAEQSSNIYSETTTTEPDFIASASQDSTAALLNHLLEDRKVKQEKHDELDRFFLSMSETCKKFSPYEQAVVKKKVFNLVSEIELQQLAPNSLQMASQDSVGSTMNISKAVKHEIIEIIPN